MPVPRLFPLTNMDPAPSGYGVWAYGLLAAACLWGVVLVVSFRRAVAVLSQGHLQRLAVEGNGRAEKLLRLREQETRFAVSLSAAEVLLLLASAFSTLSGARQWGGEGSELPAMAGLAMVALLAWTLPQYTAVLRAERIALRYVRLGLALQWLLRPVTWALERLAVFVQWMRPGVETRGEGVLEAEAPSKDQAVFRRVQAIAEARAKDVMVPRTQVIGISASATIEEALAVAAKEGHRRYPIVEDSLDAITGVLHVGDALLALSRGEARSTDRVAPFVRPAAFIPENKRVVELLREMTQDQMVVVVDEYGGTAGLLTRRDLVEEVLETLGAELAAGPEEVEVVDEKNFVVSGQTALDEVNEITGQSWRSEDFHTIGGFVFGLFGRVPQMGERIRYKGVAFEVLELEGRKIAKLKITKS